MSVIEMSRGDATAHDPHVNEQENPVKQIPQRTTLTIHRRMVGH